MTTAPGNPFKETQTADGTTVTIWARVRDWQNTLAVSVPPSGSTKFFCEIHRCTFDPRRTGCPKCLAAEPLPTGGLVS